MKMVYFIRLLLLAVVAVAPSRVDAQSSEEAALADFYGDAEFVSIATGQKQLVSRAPSASSVITAEDIEAMGATDLDQVLESVPGLHVSTSPIFYSPIYVIRGIHSKYNPQILVLINGIPITNLFQGDRNLVWGGMPVKDIARVEVIRGPGSALYGADAFAGTINIITKTAQDISGTQAGVRAGSFNTKGAWLLHGGQWGIFDAAFSLQLHNTDGQREIIDADAGSIPPVSASLAPGPVNTQRDSLDARLDLSRKDWRLRLGYQGRHNVGTGAGIADALDPSGRGSSNRFNTDLTYANPVFSRNWDVTAQLSYLYVTQDTDNAVLFAPGAFDSLFPGGFPQGFIGNPDLSERHARASFTARYLGFDNHRLTLGTGFYFGSLYRVRESKNFDPSFAPLGAVVDVSDTVPFIRTASRRVFYGLVQDEWSFAPDWTFTGGVRLDHYSDFGQTINPRLALVWQTRHDLTTKLLYGRAFRAPSFAEQFNQNNPVALGNPNLDPETIETTEIAFDYRPYETLNTRIGFYGYQMKDIIRFTGSPPTAQNTGGQTGYGMEFEWKWKIYSTLQLSGNYVFQRSTNEATGSDAGDAPHHLAYLRADWKFTPDWSLTPQLSWVAQRKRVTGDTRPAIDDYALVDVSLWRKEKGDAWGMALTARNLFDADAREPSLAPGSIPNDLPLAGRNFMLEVSYDLQ